MLRPALALLILLAPVAVAQETLESLEEPHEGIDKIWPVTVREEEAGKQRALVYRNAPSARFDLLVYGDDGAIVFNKTGTRGVQTLPALEAGEYRFFVRGAGAFQVTKRAFERENLTGFDGALSGTADAFVLTPRFAYDVGFEGDVDVEWLDLTSNAETLDPPASRPAKVGGAYVITVTGADATPYAITLTPRSATEENGTPGASIGIVLATMVALALVRRGARKTRSP